jgi:hypothetical protein
VIVCQNQFLFNINNDQSSVRPWPDLYTGRDKLAIMRSSFTNRRVDVEPIIRVETTRYGHAGGASPGHHDEAMIGQGALNYHGGFSDVYTMFCSAKGLAIYFVNEATASSDF